MKKIPRERILVLPKRSLWALLQHRRVLSSQTLAQEEQNAGRNPTGKMESHDRQEEAWDVLRSLFSIEQMPAREWLTPDLVASYDAVLVSGGDNHLQFAAQYIPKGVPVIGVNSDARAGGSHGGLLYYTPEELPSLIDSLEAGEYSLEEWPRLEVEVEGKIPMYALSQLRFVGLDPDRTTRLQFRIDDGPLREPPPSTGFIVAASAGKTGHFKSACLFVPRSLRENVSKQWRRTSPVANFVVQEPFVGEMDMADDFSIEQIEQLGMFGSLGVGQEMVVTSGTFDGQIRIDTEWSLNFSSDRSARVRLASGNPLTVVSAS